MGQFLLKTKQNKTKKKTPTYGMCHHLWFLSAEGMQILVTLAVFPCAEQESVIMTQSVSGSLKIKRSSEDVRIPLNKGLPSPSGSSLLHITSVCFQFVCTPACVCVCVLVCVCGVVCLCACPSRPTGAAWPSHSKVLFRVPLSVPLGPWRGCVPSLSPSAVSAGTLNTELTPPLQSPLSLTFRLSDKK